MASGPLPPNDELANAVPITAAVTSQNTAGATVAAGEDVSAEVPLDVGSTVWFSYAAQTDGPVTLTTLGSSYDTTLQVFRVTDPSQPVSYGNLTELDVSDDIGQGPLPPGGTSQVNFTATAGQTYYVQAGGSLAGGAATTGDLVLNASPPVCFGRGTRIRTARGDLAIEQLAVGDLALTAAGALRPVRWIGRRTVDCAGYPAADTVLPVRIRAGAMAPGLPDADLVVSPDHCLFFDDVLIPAKHLVNDATIVREDVGSVDYWHVELDDHDVLIANGMPAESYRDCGLHRFFVGGETWGDHRDPGGNEAPLHAPHVVGGPRLHAVKAWLIGRAKHRGAPRTDDPGLQVMADGCVLTPTAIRDRRFDFDVPDGVQALRLVSRSSVPAHWIADNEDPRRLGVCIADIQLDGASLRLDDAGLTAGWHPVEPCGTKRWTDGNAVLPVGRRLTVQADWFLGYPLPDRNRGQATAPSVREAPRSLRLVARA
ncbi:Hint domain-containing protein [Methylobacterium sp. ID0610]|uniref:Hint domain-containing protein n=1 Tax=Methylobacterium carpenticola TaxID=3344827 RepID=UPI0036C627D2